MYSSRDIRMVPPQQTLTVGDADSRPATHSVPVLSTPIHTRSPTAAPQVTIASSIRPSSLFRYQYQNYSFHLISHRPVFRLHLSLLYIFHIIWTNCWCIFVPVLSVTCYCLNIFKTLFLYNVFVISISNLLTAFIHFTSNNPLLYKISLISMALMAAVGIFET